MRLLDVISFDVACGPGRPTMDEIQPGPARPAVTPEVGGHTSGTWMFTPAWTSAVGPVPNG